MSTEARDSFKAPKADAQVSEPKPYRGPNIPCAKDQVLQEHEDVTMQLKSLTARLEALSSTISSAAEAAPAEPAPAASARPAQLEASRCGHLHSAALGGQHVCHLRWICWRGIARAQRWTACIRVGQQEDGRVSFRRMDIGLTSARSSSSGCQLRRVRCVRITSGRALGARASGRAERMQQWIQWMPV